MKEGYKEAYFDGWIPCYAKDDGFETDIIGKNKFYDILIDLWTPIAALNPNGFLIKYKD